MLDAVLPPLAGRRGIRRDADLIAVRVEVDVQLSDEIAVPRCGAGVGIGRRHVAGDARPHRVAAVVRIRGTETRLDHVRPREFVHEVLRAGGGDEAGEIVGLGQALAVQRVLAVEHADVERPVPHVDRVVELEVLRDDFRVNRRDARRALLADRGHEERRRGRATGAGRARARRADARRNGDDTPAIGKLEAVFGVFLVLVAGVQVVRDVRAEGVVVRDLTGFAEEAVVIA